MTNTSTLESSTGGNTISSDKLSIMELAPMAMVQRSSSSMGGIDFDPDNNNNNYNNSNGSAQLVSSSRSVQKTLLLQAVVSFSFAYICWNVPRYWIRQSFPALVAKSVPYQLTKAGDVILDSVHNQPLVEPPTIPSRFLVWTSVWIPWMVVATTSWYLSRMKRHDNSNSNNILNRYSYYYGSAYAYAWHDWHAAVCGFITAIGLSESTTQLLKLYMQRRRPNFYALCGFNVTSKTCTATADLIAEAQFSFPSGHSSLACCGMTFVVWYLLSKIVITPCHGRAAAPTTTTTIRSSAWHIHTKRLLGLTLACVCWGWALFVAASRVHDQWHHPSDVVAGLGLGFWTSTIVYHFWYPPVWTMQGGIPYSLLAAGSSGGSAWALPDTAKLPSFHE